MKVVYCANCGARLNIRLKALAKYAKIIPVVEYHECSEEIQELDLTPVDIPVFNEVERNNKFVQNLNKLNIEFESKPNLDSTLSDKRPNEFVKTTCAPRGILNQIKHNNDTK